MRRGRCLPLWRHYRHSWEEIYSKNQFESDKSMSSRKPSQRYFGWHYSIFQADDELAIFNEQRKDKRRNLFMVLTVFVTMTGMIVLDIISKHRSFAKYKDSLSKESKRKFIVMKSLSILWIQLTNCLFNSIRLNSYRRHSHRDIFPFLLRVLHFNGTSHPICPNSTRNTTAIL